ncbi:MAG: hypothetical protein P1U89_27660 [Verrucomicrobiales bacterium]|nr:hypothetical protein [Verrucomicrobiales bacterium]
MKIQGRTIRPLLVILLILTTPLGFADPLDIGSRWELFIDEYLIASKKNVALKLHKPERREIVLTTDQPWEGPTSAYFSVVQDGTKVRLYYRGLGDGADHSENQLTCVAESSDGIHFTRPNLGLIEVNGSKENNVIWRGMESHNFAPFIDTNPNVKPEARYKALGGVKAPGKNWQYGETPGGLYAFASADGIHWDKIKPEPVITEGAFDSQNLAFWDSPRKRYACFSRIFLPSNRLRAIQSSSSSDFLIWSKGIPHRYDADAPMEHFYTSATIPCPTAPHLLLSFPKRFKPARKKITEHKFSGVSDAIFMSSRDGVNWDRPFTEAWVRPGRDQKNWTERSNMTACGIYDGGNGEWSLYISEHYRHPDNRIRRLVVRQQGFASIHAGGEPGEFTTPPLKFEGKSLLLNYATSAVGHLQIEIQDQNGVPIPGFTLDDMPQLFGDALAATAKWKAGSDLSQLQSKTIRLRIRMDDADLYAIKFQ